MNPIPNYLISVSTVGVIACLLWLYYNRHGDWPKAWAILLATSFFAAVAASRYLAASGYSVETVNVSNWVAGLIGFLCAALMPWAVYVLSKFPSPAEVEHAIRGNLVKREAVRAAEIERQRKEKAETIANLLAGVMIQANLPVEIKSQVDAIITELKNDPVIPVSYPHLGGK